MGDGVRNGIISTVVDGERNPPISENTHVTSPTDPPPPTVSSLSHLKGGGGSAYRPYPGDEFISSHRQRFRTENKFPNNTLDVLLDFSSYCRGSDSLRTRPPVEHAQTGNSGGGVPSSTSQHDKIG